MRDEDLKRLRELAEAATPGPWTAGRSAHHLGWNLYRDGGIDVSEPSAGFDESDADFIAASREAVPALLDEVERLRGVPPNVRRIQELEARCAQQCDELVTAANRIATLESIVWALAAKEPRARLYNGGHYDECALCGANDMQQVNDWLTETDPKDYNNRPTFTLAHAESCPWRRAVEALRGTR